MAYVFVHRALVRLVQVQEPNTNPNLRSSSVANNSKNGGLQASDKSGVGIGLIEESPGGGRSGQSPGGRHGSSGDCGEETVMRRVMRTLMYYPLVFFVSWLPSTLYRVAEMVNDHVNLNLNFILKLCFVVATVVRYYLLFRLLLPLVLMSCSCSVASLSLPLEMKFDRSACRWLSPFYFLITIRTTNCFLLCLLLAFFAC